MNDPHVVALIYKIEHGRSVCYQEAEPQDHEADNFSVRIEDGEVHFTMKSHTHYATVEEAQEAIGEYIRCWEFDVALRKGSNRFRLEFDRPEIEDRKPPPAPSVPPGTLSVRGFRASAGAPKATIGAIVVEEKDVRSPYPPPPQDLAITPDVQSMYDRFRGYRLGREPLPAMAYFCLTVLEQSTGARGQRRRAAAKQYGIDFAVLDKIGSLSSGAGGQQARKASGIGRELTSAETRFLEKAMVALIRRAAEVAHDPNKSRDEIKLSDLP